ncbi:Asp-tRNA(Asn)/Glu-tRNA(Gln) amidotransferase subunit GatA [Candidatus Woesearchaeota archaeon]|nr:Asp-tRNA(Asn)/Glu-tRNA(Gln) amidotransferase subunit GatA [Candidatus Woesearchaeota archaeon]
MTSEFINKVRNQEIDIAEHTEKALEKVKRIDSEYHYMNTISEDLAREGAKHVKAIGEGVLAGTAVSIKDCICVKGVESTAGSKILEGYRPVFDATVVQRIKKEGGIIIGKTAQDEFGFGSFSVNVGIGKETPLNPLDKERVCGGSSGGSAGLVRKADFPHISLAESTGGSIVAPASFCGVVGLCPTYGRVSRHGLIDYANSLDKIGPIAKTTMQAALMLEIIAGHDPDESTSLKRPVDPYTDHVGRDIKGMKLGVIRRAFGEGTDDEVTRKVKDAISRLEDAGAEAHEVSLPMASEYAVPCYYLIAMCETSTNLAKLCGMRYGRHESLEGGFNEYFSKVRELNFGKEAKRRIILGTFARMAGCRDAYYIKALKVRSRIIQEYKKTLKQMDVLVSPTMPFTAPRFRDVEKLTPLQNYMSDILTAGPNVAGLPHISIPCGKAGGMPAGLMAIGDHLQESKLIQLGSALE